MVKLKEEELALIASQLALEPQNTTDLGEKEAEILAKWKNNWLGDERWLDILVNGDPEYKRDRFLEMKYDKALAKHRSYAAGGEIGKTAGAVAPLTGLGVIEKQVEEQKRRVDELRVMREAALNSLAAVQGGDLTSGESLPGVVAEKKGLPVNFTRHLVHFL